MTRRDQIAWLIFCLILLAAGYLLFMLFGGKAVDTDAFNFRVWFWSNRTIDLFVQVELLFAGALGVSVIFSSMKDEGGK